jgi:hypothetical protein
VLNIEASFTGGEILNAASTEGAQKTTLSAIKKQTKIV